MNLAAHPGHGVIAGGPPPIDQFKAILTALPQLGIMDACSLVITGYLGAVAQTDPIATVIDHWRKTRPAGSIFWILCLVIMAVSMSAMGW